MTTDERSVSPVVTEHSDLTGAAQGWLRLCGETLRERPDELAGLLDDAQPYAAAFRDGPSRWSDRPALADEAADVPDVSCAEAVLAIALALAEPARTTEVLGRALAHWQRANVLVDTGEAVVVPETTVRTAPEKLRSVLQRINDEQGGASSGCASLVALQLADRLPRAKRRVQMPVLFDRNVVGGSAVLTLEVLPGGPTGLYPHPAHMLFLVSDPGFADALGTAWKRSGLRTGGHCVVWSVQEQDEPCNDVVHDSLGAAFGAALDELRRRLPWWSWVRLRRLHPRRAITGGVADDGTLTPVRGYDGKLKAAAARRLRVIVPAGQRDDVEPLAERHEVGVDYADDLDAALRHARWLSPRQLLTVAAATAILIVGGAAGALVIRRLNDDQRHRSEIAAKASDLTAQATLKRQTDPRLAALLALASYRLNPTGAGTTDAMRDILASNQNVLRSWVASPTQVDALAVDVTRSKVYTAGDDDAIKAWHLDTGEPAGHVAGRTGTLVLNDRAPILAANDGDGVRLIDVGAAEPKLIGKLPDAKCAAQFQTIVAVHFVDAGATLLATWTDGSVSTWDVVTRTNRECWKVRAVASAAELGTPSSGRLVIGSAMTATNASTSEVEDDLLVLMNHNRVLSIKLRSKKVTVELAGDEVPAASRQIEASAEKLAVGTESGVLVWDRAKHRAVAFPAGGLGATVKAIDLRDNKLVVASAEGTAVIPGFADESGTTRIPAKPHGGAADVAELGRDNTIVAGGPGGRISVLRETAGSLTLPPAVPATAIAYTDDGSLLLSDWANGQSQGLFTVRTSDPPTYLSPAGSVYPHLEDYRFGKSLYINDAAASATHVAAAGQVRQQAAVVVWPVGGGDNPIELSMSKPDDPSLELEQRIATSVAFVKGTPLMLARNVAGRVMFWNTGTYEQVDTLQFKPGTTAMAVSGTDGIFAEGEEGAGELVQVDLLTRKELRRVAAPQAYRVTWSENGSRIAALQWGNRLQVYNDRLEPVGDAWKLPEGAIAEDIDISPDGSQLAVAQGNRVLMYDTTTHTETMPPLPDNAGNAVVHLLWSPDSGLLVGLSKPATRQRVAPGPVNLWFVKDADWTTQICRWTGGGLSRKDWANYVGDVAPFIELCTT
ncbi:hypothetical protein Drose_15595 [Dactylosporangium roseum]|uniref:Uncharacterized protein n=1 Tax=Dactylosporangium roseum TaxID=47989 RepID=A0ABY5ZFR2_9ACTN|nr:hypothetical protein [Dactylosporangium roseum]UWZ39528.1 hypothetical protein Drose_15595 [Dactylosporangium roseum]